MDEVAKCNQETTTLSFIASDGTAQTLNFVCPFNLIPCSQEAAMSYFRRIVWDKFKNPFGGKGGAAPAAPAGRDRTRLPRSAPPRACLSAGSLKNLV